MAGRKMVLGLVLIVTQLFLIVSLLCAFDEKQVQQLKKTTKCQKCDLSNANLAGIDISYADLTSANLTGADLSKSTLYGANLTGAILKNANLSGANLFEADLTKADMTGANITNANVSDATWPNGKRCRTGSIGVCK
jgi:uncharacterized protein YjbI with pentapeptide repeats